MIRYFPGEILTSAGTLRCITVKHLGDLTKLAIANEVGTNKISFLFPSPEALDQISLDWFRYRGYLENESSREMPQVRDVLIRAYFDIDYPEDPVWLAWAHANERAKFYICKFDFVKYNLNWNFQDAKIIAMFDPRILDQLVTHWLEYRGILEK